MELDPEAQLNDSIGSNLKQMILVELLRKQQNKTITQKVRDAEREIIFNEFESRKGDIGSGIARRVERRAIVVDLGRIEAYIPPREQIPGKFLNRVTVFRFISDVRQTNRGPQIIMTRAGESYLTKLFEIEVPEIYDGIVEIVAAAREPGQRAKIAVSSKDSAVDPVGACVGMKGSRVQNIVSELSGEKIDIVVWDEDPAQFVCNALAPAEISKVFLDEDAKEMEVVVPDNQLSLAIGKRGQNVRLAAKLTGYRLDITSESAASQKTSSAIFNLMLIPGMTETMAQNIFQSGFDSFQDLAESAPGEVQVIPGYEDHDRAAELIQSAVDLLQKYQDSGEEIPAAPEKPAMSAAAAISGGTAKAQADEMLKAELAALESQNGAAAEAVEVAAEETAEATTTVEAAAPVADEASDTAEKQD
ncbi:MAG: transcription termination factor NusA [Bdellovibrionales bacterium]